MHTVESLYHDLLHTMPQTIPQVRTDCIRIFCHVLQCDKSAFYAYPKRQLTQNECDEIRSKTSLLQINMPLQYILGTAEFMSLPFRVSEDVLIPRSETELLVEAVLDDIRRNRSSCSPIILELCTGSGCIAVSLANYHPLCRIVALDISESALEIAKYNAEQNNVSSYITFLKGDVLDAALYCSLQDKFGKFDIIVSNPPYIPSAEIAALDENVKHHEPRIALDGGVDGLLFYRAIAKNARSLLKEEGKIFLEAGYNTTASAAVMFQDYFQSVAVRKDLQEIDRVIVLGA